MLELLVTSENLVSQGAFKVCILRISCIQKVFFTYILWIIYVLRKSIRWNIKISHHVSYLNERETTSYWLECNKLIRIKKPITIYKIRQIVGLDIYLYNLYCNRTLHWYTQLIWRLNGLQSTHHQKLIAGVEISCP